MEKNINNDSWLDRYAYFIVVFAFGSAVTLSNYVTQQEITESAFNQTSFRDIRQAFSDAGQHIERELGTLKTIQDFADIEGDISEAQFTRMAQSILEVKPYIKAFSWAPVVSQEMRDQFVEMARSEITPRFQIRNATESGKLITSDVRDEYIPVTYIVPKRPYLNAFGFNLISEPRRNRALTLSGLQNLRVITEPLQLVVGNKLEPSVLIFAPIYNKQALDEKRLLKWDDLRGFVLMVLHTGAFYRHVFEASERDTNIALQVTDLSTGLVLAESEQYNVDPGAATVRESRIISAGQRQWQISGRNILGVDKTQNLTVTVFGIVITLILGLYIQAQRRQTLRISEEVDERTRDLKQRSDELDVANRRLELALLSTRQGIWDWDITTNEVYFSPSTEIMAGYEIGDWESSQTTWSQLIDADEYVGVLREVDRHLSGQTEFYVSEHRIRRKDGSFMWIRDHGRIVERDENGNPLRMTGSHVDIDDQKKIELELIEARDAAEQAAIAKTQFLSTMSHEIRTPMNGVMGMAQLLEDTELTDEQKEYVSTINRSGNNLLKLINEVLDFSKLDANKVELENIPFDLEEICTECLDLFTVEARENKTELVLDYDTTGQSRFIGDPSRLRQIILNLVSNAVKFTENGRIRLTVTCSPANDRYTDLVIEVEDNGIGIPESARRHLFDEFTQVDQATTRRFGGTGLGLAIVKKIVYLMSGDISVASRQDEGSRFSISLQLPVAEERISRFHARSTVKNADLSALRARVLLVEDIRANQIVASKFIEKLGGIVDLASNGREAVDMWQNGEYDIILMDCRMPVMDGYQATGTIRNLEKAKGGAAIPIIAFTANASTDDWKLCKAAGMDEVITKPFRRQELYEVFERWLDGSLFFEDKNTKQLVNT